MILEETSSETGWFFELLFYIDASILCVDDLTHFYMEFMQNIYEKKQI